MHIMCVIGVYVTDPAHNIIFGGKRLALSCHFLERVFSIYFCFRKFEGAAVMFLRVGRQVRCFSYFFFEATPIDFFGLRFLVLGVRS